ncbi:MAG: glycosyltransferase family 2 protein [Planctomycetes bacterium]|nr:glycosyltransferase family 2 protein [Planctomycetota bacterium]MCP4771011.1 glycosyltransferase family 2 protein [Planctomycetota bacterium]MCP4861730.1 glycosyltransferase family 2 protein [Planctomycetota bacterium]
MSQSSILVVIVNYRTPDLLIQCLQSIATERAGWPQLKVHVIDNNSGDGSVEKMEAGISEHGWGDWARVIASDQNPGFGAGNNVILREDLASDSPADYYFILNPDTAVCPGIFQALTEFFDANPKASILGPRTESGAGTADHTAFRFPGFWNSLCGGMRFGPLDRKCHKLITAPEPSETAVKMDWVSGGGMIVRRQVFEKVGLFDEKFFLYFEETDLCHRAHKLGHEVWYVPQARMMHWSGASTGVATGERPVNRMPGWWFASRRRYLRNFHNPLFVLCCNLAFANGRALWQLRSWIKRRTPVDPPHFLWDFVRFNFLGQRWDRK